MHDKANSTIVRHTTRKDDTISSHINWTGHSSNMSEHSYDAYSPTSSIELDHQMISLVEWTFSNPPLDPHKKILFNSQHSDGLASETWKDAVSYDEFATLIRQFIAGLGARGVQPGDCVAVNAFNGLHYAILYLGIIGAGAIFTGVNPSYTTSELIHHFKLCKPKIILVQPDLMHNTVEAARDLCMPTSSICVFDAYVEKIPEHVVNEWQSFFVHGEQDWVKVDDPFNTVAQYASTSGTSGLPKLAKLSHAYHIAQAKLNIPTTALCYEQRRLTPLPPFHAFATPLFPASVHAGIPLYIMPRFNMTKFLSAVEQHQITETYVAPPVIVALSQSPLCLPSTIASLRQIWWGGAPLTDSARLALEKRLHPDAIIQPVWGLTEAGHISNGHWPEKYGHECVGRALAGFQIKVADCTGKDVTGTPQNGDLLVRPITGPLGTPTTMLGYLDDPEATAQAFDSEGYLLTGDIGHVDKDGRIYVVDRSKDMIKVRGWQVSPAELETHIVRHEGVKDVAVIGVALEDGNEVPKAFIVKHGGADLTEVAIKEFLAKDVARYKIPDMVVFVDEIPRNPTGKILRRVLKSVK